MTDIARQHIQASQKCISGPPLPASDTGDTGTEGGVTALRTPAIPAEYRAEKPPRPLLDLTRAVLPEYQSAAARMESFAGWPDCGVPRPRQLVPAGFLYTGSRDSVRCFVCGVTLKNWTEEDDPWATHVRFRFSCNYVTAIKGEQFVIETLALLGSSEAGDGRGTEVGMQRGRGDGVGLSQVRVSTSSSAGADVSISAWPSATPSSRAPIASISSSGSGRMAVSAGTSAYANRSDWESTMDGTIEPSVRWELAGAAALADAGLGVERSPASKNVDRPRASGPCLNDSETSSERGNSQMSSALALSTKVAEDSTGTITPAAGGKCHQRSEMVAPALNAAPTGITIGECADGNHENRHQRSVGDHREDGFTSEPIVSVARTMQVREILSETGLTDDGPETGVSNPPIHRVYGTAGRLSTVPRTYVSPQASERVIPQTSAVEQSRSGAGKVPTSDSGENSCRSSTVSREMPTSTTPTCRALRAPSSALEGGSEDIAARLRQLQETNNRLRQMSTCRLCGQRPAETIFLPCGHLCTCESCAATIKDCCLCRGHIRATAHVYLQ